MQTERRHLRHLQAAEGYLLLGMHTQALYELRMIRDRKAVWFAWHALRGEILRDAQRFEEAITDLEIAHQEQPDDVSVLMALAWCYKRTDQLARAIDATHQAHQAAPQEAVLLYNLACYYTLAGEHEQALSWLARSFRMSADLRRLVADEPDFDSLRDDPRLQTLMELTDTESPLES